jgi:hypothetical protein
MRERRQGQARTLDIVPRYVRTVRGMSTSTVSTSFVNLTRGQEDREIKESGGRGGRGEPVQNPSHWCGVCGGRGKGSEEEDWH